MANKEKKERKGLFKEFKEFVMRGNVFDMAVGIIVGGAFTAIVTALCDNVLKPIINWFLALITGADSLEGIYTMLTPAYEDEAKTILDLANSIYIDWGSLINAVINFLLIALILFTIIKIINKIHEMGVKAKESIEDAAKKRQEEKEAEKAQLAAAEKTEAAAPATEETAPAAEAPVETPPADDPPAEEK